MFDVVDYWNLRAAGFHVFPLPLSHYQDFTESAKNFATYVVQGNRFKMIELVKARSVDESKLEKAGDWLVSLGISADTIALKGWVPRFGVRHYRVLPELSVQQASSSESEEVVVVTDGFGTLKGPTPDCDLAGDAASQHWATDLEVFSSSDPQFTFRLPWLTPSCDIVANSRIGHGIGAESSRVSKRGIVVIRHGERGTISVQSPTVVEVFRAFLRDAGLTYSKTSSPGLALERIIEQLGGLFNCGVFRNPAVRSLIEDLKNGAPLHAEAVRSTIYKSVPATVFDRKKELEGVLSRLVSKKVLRQGLRFQCEKCQRHDWYDLSELSGEFRCKKCFHPQAIPLLDKNPWHFVSDGLFRLEGKVAGCLSTLLSLLFLSAYLEYGLKYVPSFEYSDGSDLAERDFAALSSSFLGEDVEVIIGECKTLKELDEKQKKSIRSLGDKAQAFLSFSTLSDDFTEGDKIFFQELTTTGLRLILLTRRHLEMSSLEVSNYRLQGGGTGRGPDTLSRQTTSEALGREFAANYHRSV